MAVNSKYIGQLKKSLLEIIESKASQSFCFCLKCFLFLKNASIAVSIWHLLEPPKILQLFINGHSFDIAEMIQEKIEIIRLFAAEGQIRRIKHCYHPF